MAGRSHNVAAQATTLGKRFATVADEMLIGARSGSRSCSPATRCAASRARWAPPRTCSTCSTATPTRLAELETAGRRAPRLRPGARPASARSTRARSTSTCSPRWSSWSPAPSNLATTIRLMAGIELVTEGFKEGQVGSSAMPHKMNTRSCERVNGLAVVTPRLPLDGRRARRRPVERGRRLLLRRTPGGAARRVLRRRRALPDLPHRARRVRRVPGGDPARARPLPAVPGHHQGADGRGPQRASAARPPTRRSRRPRSASPSTCASGQAENDVFDRLAADARLGLDRARRSTPWSPSRSSSPAPPSPRSRRSSPGRGAWPPAPGRGGVHARRHPLMGAGIPAWPGIPSLRGVCMPLEPDEHPTNPWAMVHRSLQPCGRWCRDPRLAGDPVACRGACMPPPTRSNTPPTPPAEPCNDRRRAGQGGGMDMAGDGDAPRALRAAVRRALRRRARLRAASHQPARRDLPHFGGSPRLPSGKNGRHAQTPCRSRRTRSWPRREPRGLRGRRRHTRPGHPGADRLHQRGRALGGLPPRRRTHARGRGHRRARLGPGLHVRPHRRPDARRHDGRDRDPDVGGGLRGLLQEDSRGHAEAVFTSADWQVTTAAVSSEGKQGRELGLEDDVTRLNYSVTPGS